ncbi:AMP-binding protein [Cryomorpha ignava]|uniref:AMP-binding protein n=1 Tax=Cryomorpha ignava TaxID=101383 RepID=A0A7K3WPW7_9FLAO|nr:AMP-binding protein [Cryomorpha ignava]NEN22932.1 AMP-binding protein [Cryomorpha ignava]
MNPFDQYRGLRLNGKFFQKQNLLDQEYSIHNANSALTLEFARELFTESDGIFVQTSGSTGNPKDIFFSKLAVVISAQATNSFFGLSEKSIAVLPLPLQYIAGKMMVARAIVGGYNLIVIEASSNPDLSRIQADFMPVTPFQMINIIENQPESLSQIGTYLIGGGAPSAALIAKINQVDLNAYASFGMTETLSHFALANLKNTTDSPIYKPVEGAKIRARKDGTLEVNWPGITDGWLHTNDIAEIDNGGFRWLGRADNLINSGGVKIIPERVEQILDNYIRSPFFVAGVPHKTLGQELVLVSEEEIDLDLTSIKWDFKYQKPKRILVIHPFLRTVSGKIKRRATIDLL